MLELKNVSKFYYSKNVVTSGFTKVNLKLDVGEFVVVTGESGSGKSTLLNVISGLDSYEEGEMYINGAETSGYTEQDFEAYRKKYVGNIFQNFNLVNSYTVYQNVELVLLINGYKKYQIKKKILDTLKKVDLLKYKNTKVSKLSGGQKQRVAIARALIKETPIIVADEPTGNLDSKTAINIIELLKEVAKDRLIIMVTHNYEQVEKYVTRKITMHDGRIIEDKKFSKEKVENISKIENEDVSEQYEIKQNKKQKLTIFNKTLLGLRNTFNIKIKFLLLLAVYLFVSIAAVAGYSALKKQQYEESNLGYNNYFTDTNDKRIIIQKKDLSQINPEDYEEIKAIPNIDYIIENDLLIDSYLVMAMGQEAYILIADDLENLEGTVNLGTLPQNDNEILLILLKENNYMFPSPQELIGKKIKILNPNSGEQIVSDELLITGIKYTDENQAINNSRTQNKMCVSKKALDEIRKNINISYGNTQIEFNDKILESNLYNIQYRVIPSSNVPFGQAYVSEEMNQLTKRNNCLNLKMNIKVDNLYYKDSMEVKITKTYNKKNMKKLLGKEFEIYKGAIFVNQEQYSSLYDKGNYQSSVYIKDEKQVRDTLQELQNMNFKALYVKDTLTDSMGESRVFVNTFRIVIAVVVIIVLFFISYFIIKIIMKSRNIYFSIIRILGATRKNAKQLLKIELFFILNIAYIITLGLIALVRENIIQIPYIQSMITYLKISDLCILYIALLILSFFISTRYSKQLFKKSAMNTYREEEV